MKNMFCDMKLIGLESKVSAKGNPYTTGLFQQGTGVETCTFMLPQGSYNIGSFYTLECEYNFRWKSHKVVNCIEG